MVFRRTESEQPSSGTQGGSIGDKFLTYENRRNKAEDLAEWLNYANGGGGKVYLVAVACNKQR